MKTKYIIILMIKLADTHTHTMFSHDADKSYSVEKAVERAREKNLRAIAFTDHADVEYCHLTDVFAPVKASVQAVKEAQNRHEGGVELLTGIEIGEGIWHLEVAKALLNEYDYDTVISSVHAVRFRDVITPFSMIKFSFWNQESIDEFMDKYFDEVGENLEKTETDILSHLTCPLRYIEGRWGKKTDLSRNKTQIDDILRLAINKKIALEINTAAMDDHYGNGFCPACPDFDIIKRYYDFGGRMLTLGSDAHTASAVARNFDEVVEKIKQIGFTDIYYFRKRKPVKIEL